MHDGPMLQSTINTPRQLSPIGKNPYYDGTEHQTTIDTGKKKLIICTNYRNINKKVCDI